MSDDKREAVNIGITISSQLINAALAMIAVMGAFTVFVIDKKEIGFWYYLITTLAFLSFISSIFAGGKAINKARQDGYNGGWYIHTTKRAYNLQALFCIAGLIFFAVSFFSTREKTSSEEATIQLLKLQNDTLKFRIEQLEKKQQQSAIREYKNLKTIVDSLVNTLPKNNSPINKQNENSRK